MPMLMQATAILLSLSASVLLNRWFISERSPLRILDAPNPRSLHQHPTPRTGGIGILAGIVVGWVFLASTLAWPYQLNWIIMAAVAVAAISLLDDVRDLPPTPKFVVHGLAAGLLMVGGMHLPWGFFGLVITWLAIVWMTNLFNFMDGMDGFAGGMALSGFVFLGLAGWLGGAQTYAVFCWLVAVSALGFLPFNFPPARIFMGDAGAATLGLLAAGLSLWAVNDGVFPIWFPLLVFSPFVVDATLTLLHRGWRREKVWRAHRTHYYQRLVQAGWGHRKTVLAEYLLMLTVGGSALVLLLFPDFWLVGLIVWSSIYILLAYLVNTHCATHTEGAE
ncbi:MAG: glycosyltransferase family 4 protein [Mariprofundaceae bacterium]|nr:glycosyltransferase family 4 protein [Mariprofundaceae bacterium]